MEKDTIIVAAAAVAAQVYISPIHEVSTVKVLGAYLVTSIGLFGYHLNNCTCPDIIYAIARSIFHNLVFLFVATSLTLIRRLYFSPLSRFPGPKAAALSNLYLANEYRNGRTSRTLIDLHDRYKSDFVRIGPSRLSIKNVNAVGAIHRGKYPRGAFYDASALSSGPDLVSQRDYALHTPWRQIW